jgi:hypothetical protein
MCIDPIIIAIVIILLIYAHDIVLMAMSCYDLNNQPKSLKDFYSSMSMNVNNEKMKAMIIISKRITYANFMYYNNSLEEVTSYKYFGNNIHHEVTSSL